MLLQSCVSVLNVQQMFGEVEGNTYVIEGV